MCILMGKQFLFEIIIFRANEILREVPEKNACRKNLWKKSTGRKVSG